MDENKYLILDTRVGYKDLTGDVSSVNPRGDRIEIIFNKNGQPFHYLKKNIHIETSPQEIETDVEINGRIELGAEKKLLFGKFLKLFFTERKKPELHYGDFKILKSKIADALSYFYSVAQLVKNLPSEDPSAPVNTIIADAISKIKEVPTGSPLFSYLTGIAKKEQEKTQNFIFPFQCNESQLTAVEQTFSNRISLIQGPPGTGKTQTILNILLNAVQENKSVAIVSNNNSAIQNIVDKLRDADGLDFLVALLGNKDNQEAFLANQPKYPAWLQKNCIPPDGIEIKLRNLQTEIKQLFADQNALKKKQTELNAWIIEEEKFKQCYPCSTHLQDNGLSSDSLLNIFTRCNLAGIREQNLSIWFKLWNVIFCRRWSFAFWNQPIANVLTSLKRLFYQKRISELKKEIAVLTCKLANANFEEKHILLNELSWQVLKVKLQKKYNHARAKRKIFYKGDLRSEDFRAEYPVLLATTFMIKSFTPENGFDLLIMDEASQVDLCTGLVALSCAKNVVIVGDDKQLPCVITEQDELKLSQLNACSKIDKKYLYKAGQSILSSIQLAIPDVPNTTLCEHYRCDPLIIGFCNKRFYDGQLVVHSKSHNMPSLRVVFTQPGNHARGHFNHRQAQEIEVLKQQLIEKGYPAESIGVCTPYRRQAENIGASTVHKFQGREKDVIIMSTVDNTISDFVADRQLVNVAVSRAKKEFYLVVSSSNKKWNNCIGDLVNYIKYYDESGDAVLQRGITSVFDMLYQEYQERLLVPGLLDYFFDSPAEKIIYKELSEILKKHDTDQRYSFKMHIPLKEIFKARNDLTSEESAYMLNPLTHVDFLIYERFGMTPRFAVEVDGYAFHKEGTRQAERDKLKNSIFYKRHLPLLRLSTTGSRERERITDFIFGAN